MIHPIYPCIWYNGKAKAAAELYCSIFPNSKITNENPMVVYFELDGYLFMGLNGGPQFKLNPSISIFVNCSSVAELELIWHKLMVNGKALMPMDKYDWSERYGWVEDEFGLTWQLMLNPKLKTGITILPSMLFTSTQFGHAEEAMRFYTSIFEPSSIDPLMHYTDDSPHAGKVLFAEFKLNTYSLIAMDGPGEHAFGFNEAVSFVVNCDTQDEIDYCWNKLTEGGQESMCGWLRDKFGVSWQIVPSILGQLMSEPERGQRVIQAFLKMRKFDIQTLLEA